MRIRKIILIIIAIVLWKLLIDYAVKISYDKDDIYEIHNFKVNEQLLVDRGKIIVGKNSFGELEASIIPDNELKYLHGSTVEYIYLRFHADWYNQKIKPFTGSRIYMKADSLLAVGEEIHQVNFKKYMHFGDYPIVKKDYLPYIVMTKETGEERGQFKVDGN